MEKINIAEILKDCPQGMELDSPVYYNLTFDYINEEQGRIYCKTEDRDTTWFTIYGCISKSPSAKCVIFPKGKNTWEGFVPPCKFKDGDIVISFSGDIHLLRTKDSSYCAYREHWEIPYKFDSTPTTNIEVVRFATKEEKQKLFDAIKANGYRWNAETKTLEKLEVKKFDITTLNAFAKVLVRDTKEQVWVADFFSHAVNRPLGGYRFACIGHYPDQCIPYEENKHLRGTTNDCDEYYKTWEK